MGEAAQRFVDDPVLNKVLALCSASTEMVARTFFPERFYAEFSPLHSQIFNLIDSGYPYICIAAPRGIGKTSIVGLALTARKILFQQAQFIVYVSNSFENAQLQTENLKSELLTNRALRDLFGNIKAKGDRDLDESFSKKAWVANVGGEGQGTLVFPRGSGQQVRGLLYRNARPDLIIVDDLEDPETINNAEARRKRLEWFNADLMKATSRMKKDFQIVYIDTLKHHDALIEQIINSVKWKSVRLEICGDDYKSKAPTFMTDDDILAEVAYHREQGIMDVFAREFRNQPIAGEDAVFKQEYFQYYKESELENVERLETFILCDPAKTVKMHSADSAVIAVGFDAQSGRIYVRDVVARKMYPDELYNEIFLMLERFNSRVLGLEVNSLNEFITQPLRNESMARGKFFELVELNPRGGNQDQSKAQRVAAMVPYYRQGYVYHNDISCARLEGQLMQFPRPKKWDAMDCLAYFVQMLDRGERWFDPQLSDDATEEDEFAALEKEYEPLDGEDWRPV